MGRSDFGADAKRARLYRGERFRFHWLDIVHFIIRDKFYETVAFFVGWIASCSIVFLGLRQAVGSLRRAAAAAERIDLDSMGQGIVVTGVPTEIRPIIAA